MKKISDSLVKLIDGKFNNFSIDKIIQVAVEELLRSNPGVAYSVVIGKPFITRVADDKGNVYTLIDYEDRIVYDKEVFQKKSLELYESFYKQGPSRSC